MNKANEERAFLHDMASPLTSLQMNMENMITMLEAGKADDLVAAKTMAEICLRQIGKMTCLVQHRRSVLILETEGK